MNINELSKRISDISVVYKGEKIDRGFAYNNTIDRKNFEKIFNVNEIVAEDIVAYFITDYNSSLKNSKEFFIFTRTGVHYKTRSIKNEKRFCSYNRILMASRCMNEGNNEYHKFFLLIGNEKLEKMNELDLYILDANMISDITNQCVFEAKELRDDIDGYFTEIRNNIGERYLNEAMYFLAFFSSLELNYKYGNISDEEVSSLRTIYYAFGKDWEPKDGDITTYDTLFHSKNYISNKIINNFSTSIFYYDKCGELGAAAGYLRSTIMISSYYSYLERIKYKDKVNYSAVDRLKKCEKIFDNYDVEIENKASVLKAIGDYYRYGYSGTEKDYSKASAYYMKLLEMKGIEKTYSDAKHFIGLCYRDGLGGLERNEDAAMYWFQEAANNEYGLAEYELFKLYRKIGDEQQAQNWRMKAKEHGIKDEEMYKKKLMQQVNEVLGNTNGILSIVGNTADTLNSIIKLKKSIFD